MAVVSFWSNCNEKETGQTLSSVAVAVNMAIEHNYKILLISTGYRDKTVERCFWPENRGTEVASILGMRNLNSMGGVNNGIEGLVKILQSNRTSSNIVSDYVKVVFRDNRLDILPAPTTENYEEYNEIANYYPKLLEIADREYDLIFIDIDRKMNIQAQKEILNKSNGIVFTMKQGLDDLQRVLELREKDEILSGNNVIYLIGKYDKFSKYNIKNIAREFKGRTMVSAISYNTLFGEATTEGKVADFFLKYRSVTDPTDRNMKFMEEANNTCQNIISKLQEIRMRM